MAFTYLSLWFILFPRNSIYHLYINGFRSSGMVLWIVHNNGGPEDLRALPDGDPERPWLLDPRFDYAPFPDPSFQLRFLALMSLLSLDEDCAVYPLSHLRQMRGQV